MYGLRQSFRQFLGSISALHEGVTRLSYHSISQIYKQQELGSRINLKGWVKAVRKMKGNNFLDVHDGSSFQSMQVVVPKSLSPENLTYGCSIEIEGTLNQYNKGQLEVKADSINVVGPCILSDGYPFQPRKSHDSDYLREYLHLRNRTNNFSSLLRLRSHMTHYIHEHFHKNDFVHIHTPILTSNDCEGGGEVFTVLPEHATSSNQNEPLLKDPSETFFNGKAYLSVSGQLHLEAMARSLSKVYTLNPVFRAENSKSRFHLSEFYMAEAELAFLSNIHNLLSTIETFVKSVVAQMLEHHSDELTAYRKMNNIESLEDLEWIKSSPFIRMSYRAATTILTKNGFEVNPEGGLSKQHELFLVKYTNNIPIFILNWPRKIKPFYMKRTSEDPEQVHAVDLLCPLVGELCGGGLREDCLPLLQSTLFDLNLQDTLDWYLELRKYGNVPTGGFGVGLERFVQLVCGTYNIRDAIPFPRYPLHCKL